MSMLSVRLPKELDRALPRKERSAWVLSAIREQLRRDPVVRPALGTGRRATEYPGALSEHRNPEVSNGLL